ncbi:hypothetical protein KSZ_24360 [Dictyobacter formicarum]|uniref:Uncharacterized protein n=1 Tax=Dictyobacter formicarum TaxID=2778368 RepID=A0ABQ3VEM7_9CHLR|nr:hypothetical protein KSZ_24360 [Dictyobacter formicarum]
MDGNDANPAHAASCEKLQEAEIVMNIKTLSDQSGFVIDYGIDYI